MCMFNTFNAIALLMNSNLDELQVPIMIKLGFAHCTKKAHTVHI